MTKSFILIDRIVTNIRYCRFDKCLFNLCNYVSMYACIFEILDFLANNLPQNLLVSSVTNSMVVSSQSLKKDIKLHRFLLLFTCSNLCKNLFTNALCCHSTPCSLFHHRHEQNNPSLLSIHISPIVQAFFNSDTHRFIFKYRSF